MDTREKDERLVLLSIRQSQFPEYLLLHTLFPVSKCETYEHGRLQISQWELDQVVNVNVLSNQDGALVHHMFLVLYS